MTRRFLVLFALAGLASALAAPPARAALATSEDFQRVCDEFYKIELDPARVHDVTNATLTRDIGTIRMTKGVLVFSKAIEGVTPIAVFIGDGSFTVTPVRKMDREMLTIATKDHLNRDVAGMINSTITDGVFVSYDKTWEELMPSLSAPRQASEAEMDRAQRSLRDRLHIIDTIEESPELGLISAALKQPSGQVAVEAHLNTADLGWLVYSWSPGSTYETRLVSYEAIGAFFQGRTLLNGQKKADLDQAGRYVADPNVDLHELLKVKRYRMDLEIPDLQQIDITIDVTFTPRVDGLHLVPFDLVNDTVGPHWNSRAKWIDIKSLKDSAGNELPFIHRKGQVLTLLKEGAAKDKDVTLTFKLVENTIVQLSDVHYSLLNTFAWFPQYGYLGGQYETDWTIKTVKPLSATGSGKVVKRWEEDKYNAVQMVFEQSVQFPSLLFGRFKEEDGEYTSPSTGSKIPIAVHYWPKVVYKITDPTACEQISKFENEPSVKCPISFELDVPPAKPKDVVDEGKTILKFMEDLYGPFGFERMDVAMMAPFLGFGQAPPSFVQLTGEAFMSPNTLEGLGSIRLNFFHGFFSHELAHQWWGHKVGWIADDDQWLSESFAEYAAGLYVLNYLGKGAFDQKMKEWRDNARIGDPHASIAWSNRVSGPQQSRWYIGLIYNKGPYVVHMLRMQMGLDNFKKAMQSVFTKYGHTNISTDMLQRECELVMGYKLDFFFDQWFRGTGIPTFDYSWTDEPTPDGKHLVTIKISQRDKQNFKQVRMPVYLYFKGKKEPLIKPRDITTADHTYKLSLPEKPSRIALDEGHDILGDMIPAGAGTGQ